MVLRANLCTQAGTIHGNLPNSKPRRIPTAHDGIDKCAMNNDISEPAAVNGAGGTDMSILAACSQLVRDNIGSVAMALVASLMAVYGSDVGRAVRVAIRGHNFFVRAGIFFFLVVFGYGALALATGSFLARLLRGLDDNWLAPLVALAFLAIAIAAEERRHI
jgi:hypothetical protein